MVKLQSRTIQICMLFVSANLVLALAQVTGPGTPATCATPPPSITNLLIEHGVNLSGGSSPGTPGSVTPGTGTPGTGLPSTGAPATGANGNGLPGLVSTGVIFATATPNISTNVQAAIAAGALELREQLSLNTQSTILTIQSFVAQPGSPSPTPLSAILSGNVVSISSIQVDRILFSCQPVPSLLITGRVINNFPYSPFGNLNGALVAVGIGYTTDNPALLNNVTVMYPGIVGEFTGTAAGTLTFPVVAVNPPVTSGTQPLIVFTPGQTQTTFSRSVQLDASKSTDPNGLQLTYLWTQVNNNLSAGISNEKTPTPTVTFDAGQGDYTFMVTVTNSKGVQNTATTTITYYGR